MARSIGTVLIVLRIVPMSLKMKGAPPFSQKKYSVYRHTYIGRPSTSIMYGQTTWELAVYKELIEQIREMMRNNYDYDYNDVLDLIDAAVGEDE